MQLVKPEQKWLESKCCVGMKLFNGVSLRVHAASRGAVGGKYHAARGSLDRRQIEDCMRLLCNQWEFEINDDGVRQPQRPGCGWRSLKSIGIWNGRPARKQSKVHTVFEKANRLGKLWLQTVWGSWLQHTISEKPSGVSRFPSTITSMFYNCQNMRDHDGVSTFEVKSFHGRLH